MNSNQKGKRGEREAAKVLNELFDCHARRGQQFSGSEDSPDVVTDMEDIHFEVKFTDALRLYEAIEQAQRDAGEGQIPIVLHRRTRKPWLAIVPLEDLPRLPDALNHWLPEEGE